MAKKSDKVEAQEVVERDGSAEELAAYMHLRATGRNDLGYHEPTRDQETDVAPERGVMPGLDLFNPPPPEGVPLDIARPAGQARINVQPNSRDALPVEDKEELGPVDPIAPQQFSGADEDGNLPEVASVPGSVQRVMVVKEEDYKEDAAEVEDALQADADKVVVNDGKGGTKQAGE